MDGNIIKVDINIFSLVFNSTVGSKDLELPLNTTISGMQIIPANITVIKNIADSIGSLFGESDLDIFITTSRGEGGVYHDNENLALYVLVTANCFIKIFHIEVSGENTTQIFPNRYEANNYLQDASFKFSLTEPYGSKYIKIVAIHFTAPPPP